MNEDNSKGKRTVILIVFLVMTVSLLALILFALSGTGNKKGDDNTLVTDNTSVTEVTRPAEVWDVNPETKAEIVTTPGHISQQVLSLSESDSELTDVDTTLDKNSKKTFKINLTEFAEPGDIIDSFTFYFHAEDGASNLGDIKGGFGISVDNACEAKTDNIWYQTPEDFSVQGNGPNGSVKWDIPDEIKEYVTVPKGSVLFGYWWSNVDRIVVDRVVCHRRTKKYISVDGENTVSVAKVLKAADDENTISIPLSELIKENENVSSIELTLEGAETVSEACGKFKVDTGKYNGGSYECAEMIVGSEDNTVKFKWILSDVVKRNADYSGNFEFILERCSLPELTAKEFKVEYAEK